MKQIKTVDLSPEQQLRIVSKETWTVEDLQALTGWSKSKASSVKKRLVEEHHGAFRYDRRLFLSDSYFSSLGKNRDEIIASLQKACSHPQIEVK